MTFTETTPPHPTDAPARATYAAFVALGMLAASWISRIPQIKHRLGLDASELGLLLLAVAAGSVTALPLSGVVVTRWGPRATVKQMARLAGLGLAVAAVGCATGAASVAVGLFTLGVGTAGWDVAMNVHGARVEQRLGRSIMPRFHAGFSVGTVIGALTSTVIVAAGVSVTAHLAVVALAVAVAVPLGVRPFLGGDGERPHHGADPVPSAGRRALGAWGEPRTLLIGVFVLALAFAEGSGSDWISVGMIEDRRVPAAVGTLAYATFVAAMTAGRWFGPRLLDRYGRVPVIRGTLAAAIPGLAIFVLAPSAAVGFLGTILWGFGISLGFPTGMTAGADDPARAATRVSVIASVGYCAFLGGPPLIGFLAQRSTVPHALVAVIILLGIAFGIAGALAPERELAG